MKKCMECKNHLDYSCFTKEKSVCKKCRADAITKNNRKRRIAEREIKRNELKRKFLNGGLTEEDWNRAFIKEEDLQDVMKQTDKYGFCEATRNIKDVEFSRDDYINGYILDVYMISRNEDNTVGLVWII